MPTTSPEKVVLPAAGDAYQLTRDLGVMMGSIRSVVPVANTADRAAVISALVAAGTPASASRPVYVHRADAAAGRELEYTIDGTTWRSVTATPITPYAMAAGSGSLAMTGTTGSVSITLPAGRFTVPPLMTMTTRHASYGVVWSIVATSVTNANALGTAGGAGLTIPYQWTAVQMTSTTAEG